MFKCTLLLKCVIVSKRAKVTFYNWVDFSHLPIEVVKVIEFFFNYIPSRNDILFSNFIYIFMDRFVYTYMNKIKLHVTKKRYG